MLKMVGDEVPAREMCKDTEDKSSSGTIAETLKRIEKGKQMGKGRRQTHMIGWVSDVLGRGKSPFSHAGGIKGVSMANCSSRCKLGDARVKVTGCEGCIFVMSLGGATSESAFWDSGWHNHQASVLSYDAWRSLSCWK